MLQACPLTSLFVLFRTEEELHMLDKALRKFPQVGRLLPFDPWVQIPNCVCSMHSSLLCREQRSDWSRFLPMSAHGM